MIGKNKTSMKSIINSHLFDLRLWKNQNIFLTKKFLITLDP